MQDLCGDGCTLLRVGGTSSDTSQPASWRAKIDPAAHRSAGLRPLCRPDGHLCVSGGRS
jgi:hypothetical protein